MYLRLMPYLLHFLLDLGALYAMHPTFMKSTPDILSLLYGGKTAEPNFQAEPYFVVLNKPDFKTSP
jgi:hypothetical protein